MNKIPKLIFIFITIALSVSCTGSKYVNHKLRYSVNIPDGYTLVSPTDKSESNRQMILRIKNDNALPLYENVEAAMYRAESSGPVFDTITVSSANTTLYAVWMDDVSIQIVYKGNVSYTCRSNCGDLHSPILHVKMCRETS